MAVFGRNGELQALCEPLSVSYSPLFLDIPVRKVFKPHVNPLCNRQYAQKRQHSQLFLTSSTILRTFPTPP